MNRKLVTLTFALLLLVTPLTAVAGICDDINDMANGWNDVANAINELDLADITEDEAAEIDAAIQEIWDATMEFADLLIEHGNDEEAGLGEDLSVALDDLYNAETINEVVDTMDGVTDALDAITDYCDG